MPKPNVSLRRSQRLPHPAGKRPRRTTAQTMAISARLIGASLIAGAMLVLSPFARADSPKVFQFALQNGMQVLVVPDHRAPVITQMLWFKVGGVDDPPGISGLAHFFE